MTTYKKLGDVVNSKGKRQSIAANCEMIQTLQLSGKNLSEVEKKMPIINKVIGNLSRVTESVKKNQNGNVKLKNLYYMQ